MDAERFDTIARGIAASLPRRRLLRGLLAGAVAGLFGPGGEEAAAGPGNFVGGRRCRYDRQCCSGRCREGVCAGPPNLSRCRPTRRKRTPRPMQPPTICTPTCGNNECGPDGCGGSCGPCGGAKPICFAAVGSGVRRCEECNPDTNEGCPLEGFCGDDGGIQCF